MIIMIIMIMIMTIIITYHDGHEAAVGCFIEGWT